MEEAPKVKAVIAFGTKLARNGNTPIAIKYFYRTLMFLGGLFALLEPQFPGIPKDVVHNIDKWILIGNTIIYYVCQQFGWVLPTKENTKEVQTTEV